MYSEVVFSLVIVTGIPLLLNFLKHPIRAFYLFVLLIPVAEYYVPTPFVALSTSNILTLIILVALFFGYRAIEPERQMPFLVKANLFALGLLVVSYLIASVGAINKSATIRFVITSFGFALTFWMPIVLIRNIEEYRKTFIFIAASVFLLSLATLLGAFDYLPGFLNTFVRKSFSDSRTVIGTHRLQVFMHSRGGYGSWVESGLPVVLLGILWKEKFFLKSKTAMLLIGAVMVLGLIVPSSRSTWAAGLLASLIVLGCVGRYRIGLPRITIFVISLCAAVPFVGKLAAFIQKIYEMNPRSVVKRYEWMIAAMKTVKENYLVGLGTGVGPTAFASGLGVHNQFLDMLVTNGVVGFFVLVWLWVTGFYMCFKVVAEPGIPALRFYGMCLLASLAAIFFELQCYAGRNKIMWLVLGFANCLYSLNRAYTDSNAIDQHSVEASFAMSPIETKLKGANL